MAGVHPDDRQRLQKLIDEALDPKNGGKYLSEFRAINKKDGKTRWIKATGKIFFENGRAIKLVGTAEDITESKQAEEALQESEKRYHQLFNNMTEGFFLGQIILDKQGLPTDYVFLDANEGFEKQSGLRREDIIAKTVRQALPGIEKSWIEAYGRVALTQKPERFQNYNRNTERWYEVYAYCPVKGQFAVMFTDITESKRIEEILLKQAALIDLSPDGVIIKNLDDTVTFWSEGAKKLYGWTKEEAIGRKVVDLFRPVYPDDSSAKDVLQRLKMNGKWAGQLIHHAKNGREIIVMSTWLAMTNNIGGMEILESNADITEQMRLQIQLEETAAEVEQYATRMEELAQNRLLQLKDAERMAAIGQTAGMVGHDIRNPLQSILSELYLAKTELQRITEREIKDNISESLTNIEEEIAYINKIVEDLLDFARPVRPVFQETDLGDICEILVSKAKIPSKITVSYSVEKAAKTIVTDPGILRRVLQNLVNNALQAMPDGGNLRISATRQMEDTVISVSDDGMGIPKEVQSKLFTPLFTTKSKGQGFGLAAVKQLMEAMGGTVAFESEVGKGTKFIVRLPPSKVNKRSISLQKWRKQTHEGC